MNMDSNRMILVGKAASGKDFLRKLLQEEGITYQISYTTRPPRTTEVDGVDYFFLSREDFQDMIESGKFYEYVEFNGWFYGTSKEQFSTKNSVFIMTPTGLSHLTEKERDESLVIYLDIPENIRKERMLTRNDADSVERRLIADNIDFQNFENYDICIDDPNFTIEYLYDTYKEYKEYGKMILKLINK